MRSGSSHLVRSLGKLFDHRVTTPQIGFAGRAGTDEHIVNYAVLAVQYTEGRYIYHQHCKATGNNLHILKAHGFTPIVLMRNLYDSLVSVFDQMPASPHMTMPGAFRPPWEGMSEEQQWSWIAYNAIPWYLNFYASWMAADIPKHVIYYDTFYQDQVAGIRGILNFLNVEGNLSDEKIAEVVNLKDNSFHVGVSGRGKHIPDFVTNVAEQQVRAWGALSEDMRRDLLCNGA